MTNTANGDNAIPPKLSFKPAEPGVPEAEEGKKHTARVDLPQAAPEPAAILKKKTSRIPLEQAGAEPGAPTGDPVPGVGASKTIRLAPVAAVPTITIAPSPKAVSAATLSEDIKRQTSRIPLDEATATKVESQPSAPKTIRIKRPSGLQSAPILPPTPQEEEALAPETAGKSVTSRIDLPEEAGSGEGQATQRKTIKIRRAEGGTVRPAPRSLAVARVEAQAAARVEQEVAAPHAIFPMLAAAALVLLCVMVYVLLLQAFPDLNWSFPGKITL